MNVDHIVVKNYACKCACSVPPYWRTPNLRGLEHWHPAFGWVKRQLCGGSKKKIKNKKKKSNNFFSLLSRAYFSSHPYCILTLTGV